MLLRTYRVKQNAQPWTTDEIVRKCDLGTSYIYMQPK